MGGYTKKDAAKDTKTSTSKVSKAWHDARNDAEKSKSTNFRRGDSNKGRISKKK